MVSPALKRTRNGSSGKTVDKQMLKRAQGCLVGQIAGDSLGSIAEFKTAAEIFRLYPQGIRDLSSDNVWNTLPGQPTDDSEMALMLARMLAALQCYDQETALEAYTYWMHTEPFDCGRTIGLALHGIAHTESQANGALMRISPLGIFGAWHPLTDVLIWAQQDAALTHPHVVCKHSNALYAMAIACAVRRNLPPEKLYTEIVAWAEALHVAPEVMQAVKAAKTATPEDYFTQSGWVLIALQNALWQLLHAPNLEEGVIDTVMRGGDTDTNAAICGALLGAVHGIDAIPERWLQDILNCRPDTENPAVRQPRPECFWPVDVLELARQLVSGSAAPL